MGHQGHNISECLSAGPGLTQCRIQLFYNPFLSPQILIDTELKQVLSVFIFIHHKQTNIEHEQKVSDCVNNVHLMTHLSQTHSLLVQICGTHTPMLCMCEMVGSSRARAESCPGPVCAQCWLAGAGAGWAPVPQYEPSPGSDNISLDTSTVVQCCSWLCSVQ